MSAPKMGGFTPQVAWKLNAGGYLGVLMPRHVMKKLIRLAAKHEEAVKAVLEEHESELYAHDWTINQDWEEVGKQITVTYVDPDEPWCSAVRGRIDLFRPNQPERVEFYHCTREEAEQIACEIARGEGAARCADAMIEERAKRTEAES